MVQPSPHGGVILHFLFEGDYRLTLPIRQELAAVLGEELLDMSRLDLPCNA
jgi:hypothetical protein